MNTSQNHMDSPCDFANEIKAFPGCADCLWGLARTAAQLGAGDNSEIREKAEKAGMDSLKKSLNNDLTSPESANLMLRAVRRITGNEDPYLDIKIQELELAGRTIKKVQSSIGDDLHSLLSLAALGNSLDFFRPAHEVMPEVEAAVGGKFTFYQDDSKKLDQFLSESPKTIVYLSDNSGEIFFDLPLFRRLKKTSKKITLAVKGGPALNDLTREDLARAGLTNEFPELADTGVDGAGIDWNHVSGPFKELLEESDLIISKGMANLETLYGRRLPSPVFFIFKVKCTPIRDFLKAPAESYWALWMDKK